MNLSPAKRPLNPAVFQYQLILSGVNSNGCERRQIFRRCPRAHAAKEIELGDKFENMGAQMVREVAQKTNDQAGDGTTTATVLAHGIVKEGARAVAAGMNPMDLKCGIDLAVAAVVEDLKGHAKKVTANGEIAQVATISANGDAEIGRYLAEAMQKVAMRA